jgi:hypothetical protein
MGSFYYASLNPTSLTKHHASTAKDIKILILSTLPNLLKLSPRCFYSSRQQTECAKKKELAHDHAICKLRHIPDRAH